MARARIHRDQVADIFTPLDPQHPERIHNVVRLLDDIIRGEPAPPSDVDVVQAQLDELRHDYTKFKITSTRESTRLHELLRDERELRHKELAGLQKTLEEFQESDRVMTLQESDRIKSDEIKSLGDGLKELRALFEALKR